MRDFLAALALAGALAAVPVHAHDSWISEGGHKNAAAEHMTSPARFILTVALWACPITLPFMLLRLALRPRRKSRSR